MGGGMNGRLFVSAIVALGLAHAAPEDPIFRDRIEPILKANCAGCHSGALAQGGLSVANLSDLLKGRKRGPAISPRHAGRPLPPPLVPPQTTPRIPTARN